MVKDAKKAAKWYKEKLGFEIVTDDEHWTTVGVKDGQFCFHLCPDEPLEAGNQGIVLKCDDLDKTYKDLQGRGVKFTMAPTKQEWGTIESRFTDLDGNEFTLIEE